METSDVNGGPAPARLLAEVLGTSVELIICREELEYWRKPDRRVERVTWLSAPDGGEPRTACVKCGAGLEREALAYTVLLDPTRDPVPQLIGYRPLRDGTSVVAIEWLGGRTPNFWNADDLIPVFECAGQFAARWAARIAASSPAGAALAGKPVPASLKHSWAAFLASVRTPGWYEKHLRDDAVSVLDRARLLEDIGGAGAAAAACRQIRILAPRLAATICSVPLTLDPGDFADENAFLSADGTACLLDFDNLRIAPVVQMLESVGEDWSSQPRPNLVEPALRAFADAWNAVELIPLEWDQFRAAHHSLRVWRKCGELEYILRDRGRSCAEDSAGEYAEGPAEFAQECAGALPVLLQAAVDVLPPTSSVG